MAHWQGLVMGNRGDATRLGSKKSGMQAYVASWSGRCEVDGYVNGEGIDCVRVTLTQHHNAGVFPAIELYDGPIGRYNLRRRRTYTRLIDAHLGALSLYREGAPASLSI